MKIDIEKLTKQVKPVLYIHKGKNEILIGTLVDPEWLGKVYKIAVEGGFKDPYCTKYGQEIGFLPHNHAVFNEDGKEAV